MSSAIKKLILALEEKQTEYRAKQNAATNPTMREYYEAVATGIGIAIHEAIREAAAVVPA